MASRIEKLSGTNRELLEGALLAFIVILTYLPVRSAGFIWDDDLFITANPCIVGPFGLKDIWTTTAFANVCPLAITTFWIEHAIWGLTPGPYHVVNVFMHAACAIALWRVLHGLRVPSAWLGAGLWALHPVQVESVAWISEQKNTESGLFFLLTIFFFLKWRDTRNREKYFDRNYALVLFLAALAMACKSSTTVLPVVLCLCAWWMDGRWSWRNLAVTAPVFLLSAIAVVSSAAFERGQIADLIDLGWQRTWPERFVAAGRAIWFYLDKLAWPQPLMTIYPHWKLAAESWVSYLPLVIVVNVLALLWALRTTWLRPLFFVYTYYLVAVLPVLGFVDNTIFQYALVFDHFQYLASMGPLALVGAILARLMEMSMPGRRFCHAAFYAAVLLILGIASNERSRVYETSTALWTDALAKNPDSFVVHYNFANELLYDHQFKASIPEYLMTLDLNSNYVPAYNNLGIAFGKTGRPYEAIDQFQRALQLKPGDPDAQRNLALIYSHLAARHEPLSPR